MNRKISDRRFYIPAATATLLALAGCVQGETTMKDRSLTPCADKPNCVSTQDERKDFHLAPFELANDNISMARIVDVALMLPGARVAEQDGDYARIECVSKIMRFVDDLELRIDGDKLIVRSESRIGYSDFGVNRKRADQLRQSLQKAGLIK